MSSADPNWPIFFVAIAGLALVFGAAWLVGLNTAAAKALRAASRERSGAAAVLSPVPGSASE